MTTKRSTLDKSKMTEASIKKLSHSLDLHDDLEKSVAYYQILVTQTEQAKKKWKDLSEALAAEIYVYQKARRVFGYMLLVFFVVSLVAINELVNTLHG